MIRICPECKVEYDDTYRLTYCPHEPFEMSCVFIADKDRAIHATNLRQLAEAAISLANNGETHIDWITPDEALWEQYGRMPKEEWDALLQTFNASAVMANNNA